MIYSAVSFAYTLIFSERERALYAVARPSVVCRL